MDKKINEDQQNLTIVKPLGHESLHMFFERIVKELAENKYGDSVILDCGEEIMIVADQNSTFKTIDEAHGKEFIEGYPARYAKFEARVAQIKG